MKICIATPLYPPAIGGPSEYSKRLADAFKKKSVNVAISTFTIERYLPTGIRHIWYFLKILPKVVSADVVIALDTWSVALPAVVAGRLLGKKVIIRTGGDFLWEFWVERTKQKVLLSEFYTAPRQYTLKEKIIFRLTKFTLHRASAVVFSTRWQEDIWQKPYELSKVKKTAVIENYYGPQEFISQTNKNKTYIGSTRKLVWKNGDVLEKAFALASQKNPELSLMTDTLPYDAFMERMKKSYAVILVSLGDISPNMVLDAIRLGKPFILTKENGLDTRIGNLGFRVDPMDPSSIAQAIIELARSDVYEREVEKLKNFSFVHTYDDIAEECMTLYHQLS